MSSLGIADCPRKCGSESLDRGGDELVGLTGELDLCAARGFCQFAGLS